MQVLKMQKKEERAGGKRSIEEIPDARKCMVSGLETAPLCFASMWFQATWSARFVFFWPILVCGQLGFLLVFQLACVRARGSISRCCRTQVPIVQFALNVLIAEDAV